ncbi:MAG: pentapeptide repeat-containing protein [Actinomycetota bacterium]|nr:pentapeptide repeat-containing protein [Actinomycetota bacterium]
MGKAPLAPYPPDQDDDVPPPTDVAELVDVTVEGADWANSRPVRGMEARRAELQCCRLTGAELAEAKVSDVTFDDCRLDLVNLRSAKLERVVFRDCRMNECDFYEASLKDVLFERCQLREATFSSATLQRVELRGCDLAGVRGVESLRGSRMPWSDVLENAALFATAVGIEIID